MYPIHPGVHLKEYLEELGLSQNAFAKSLGVSPMRISHIIHGSRPITAEMAILFGKAFNQTPQFWMNLQNSYDLKLAEKVINARRTILQPLALAA